MKVTTEDALKEMTGRADQYLVMLSSKTYVFEDDLTRCWSVWLICFFLCVQGKGEAGELTRSPFHDVVKP